MTNVNAELFHREYDPKPCPECGMTDEHDDRCPIYRQECQERAEDSEVPADWFAGGFADNH